jgi:hypothetical protein
MHIATKKVLDDIKVVRYNTHSNLIARWTDIMNALKHIATVTLYTSVLAAARVERDERDERDERS